MFFQGLRQSGKQKEGHEVGGVCCGKAARVNGSARMGACHEDNGLHHLVHLVRPGCALCEPQALTSESKRAVGAVSGKGAMSSCSAGGFSAQAHVSFPGH